MKEQDEQLLLIDLCARLPYGVHLFTNSKHHIRLLTISNDIEYNEQYWVNGLYDIDEVKPYLRPMSSMTEQERNEFQNLCNEILFGCIFTSDRFDWLNAHHFDYRGLIEKGLAIEAPDNMYKEEHK